MYIKKVLVLTVLFFGLLANGNAQETSYGQQYLNGKAFFKEGKYALAKEAFKPVIARSYGNNFSEYASFYYGLAAYRLGEIYIARDMFLQIDQFFPKWNNRDELYYWLASIYFSEGQASKGLAYIDKIKDKAIADKTPALKQHFFTELPLDELLILFNDYGKDPVLGKTIADKIVLQPLSQQDRTLLTSIIKSFELDPEQYNVVGALEVVKKDSYNVAVLLPFFENEMGDHASEMSNQWIKDIYLGMQTGKDSLALEGYTINLVAYDTKKDAGQVAMLLESGELNNVDLIVGPLYPETHQLVSNYCYDKKINLVHPLSKYNRLIGNNPYSFLFQPSYQSQAQRAHDLIDSLQSYGGAKVLIVAEKNPRDSTKVQTFKMIADSSQLEVVHILEVHRDSTVQITNYLTKTGASDEDFIFKKDSVDFIYVASDRRILASKIISSIQERSDSTKIIGDTKWLDYPSTNYTVLENLQVFLIGDNYIDINKSMFAALEKKYIRKFRAVPNRNYFLGFELISFFGKSLHQNGLYFQTPWIETPTFDSGILSAGFNYGVKNDNQYIPVYQLVDGKLTDIKNIDYEN